MKIKGITSGTYLLKRIKDKNTKLSSKEIVIDVSLKILANIEILVSLKMVKYLIIM